MTEAGVGGALGQLSVDEFLARYWQQKPCLIAQPWPKLKVQLDGHDLAGLACEEFVESRLVRGNARDNDWQVQYGPLAERDFERLPDSQWSLLVQDVEKHFAPMRSVLNYLDFLPSWRFDDIMLSYSAPGGSVGPHVDQYDVFLLQLEGDKVWRLAECFDPELLPQCDLEVLRHFEPEVEWTLSAGDLLYLPPGVAHHGIALDAGITCSIGMRAPSAADILQALGEWLAENHGGGSRYRDPSPVTPAEPGEITGQTLAELRNLIHPDPVEEDFHAFAGEFISRFRLAEPPAPCPGASSGATFSATANPEEDAGVLTDEQFEQRLHDGSALQHDPWTRLCWYQVDPRDSSRNSQVWLFAAGSKFCCTRQLAIQLCRSPERPLRWRPGSPPLSTSDTRCLLELLRLGHLRFVDSGA